MPPSRLFHTAPPCASGQHPTFFLAGSRRFERDSGYQRVAPAAVRGVTFQNLPAYIVTPDISRALSSRKEPAPSLYRTHLIRSPVGCLISHPLDTFFIARLTISDNAGARGETKESATTARPIRDLLTNVRKPALESISALSPRSRYTSAINHISR